MILFIHCRRGLFQLTKCGQCGHTWQCQNCTANLITYQRTNSFLELLCHQCQTSYPYPSKCPSCGADRSKIWSKYGGIEELVTILETEFEKQVVRLDQGLAAKAVQNFTDSVDSDQVCVTTRLFDPGIDYAVFDQIILIQPEGLLASPDYLVLEETYKSLAEIMLQIKDTCELILDTEKPDLDFFARILELNSHKTNSIKIWDWYTQLLEKELESRRTFKFPPFWNLLLLTTNEKDKTKAKQILIQVGDYLKTLKTELPGIQFGQPYEAKFLKRKNLYSYHLLLRFEREYPQYNPLKKTVQSLASQYNLQVRLNPRHLF